MKKIIYNLILLFLISINGISQEQAQFSMYRFNPLTFNPAYAGSRDALSVTALGRKQWVSLEGAPTTGVLTIHTPLKGRKLNAGLSFNYDEIGSTKKTSVFGDISYRLNLNSKTRISFGVKGGVDLYTINYSNLEVMHGEDPILNSPVRNQMLPNFGVGIYIDNENSFVGLASPRLLNGSVENGAIAGNGLKQMNHYYFMAGHTFKIKSYFDLIPITNFKMAPNSPLSIDLNVNGLFYDKYWVGLGVRFGDAILASFMYEFTEQFRIGYAYDRSISELSSFNNGSHELMINYDMNYSKYGVRTPRKF